MLFGLPIEIITMLGSALFSGIMTMQAKKAKDQMEFNKLALRANKQYIESQEILNKTDKGFSFTRRVIALVVVGVTAFVLLAPAFLNVPTVLETELVNSYLFGLWNDTEIIHTIVNGFVLPGWWSTAFTSIIGLYFGHSMTK